MGKIGVDLALDGAKVIKKSLQYLGRINALIPNT
jgi:hypothetical protein